ncbi:hypothetical protein RUM43_003617 [Polyplax serrata]|uniref:Uncharacterized protein n=1 Tax=Polyplax serrata TaxID=468196 RepID=A0AAN8S5M8_POLSC
MTTSYSPIKYPPLGSLLIRLLLSKLAFESHATLHLQYLVVSGTKPLASLGFLLPICAQNM